MKKEESNQEKEIQLVQVPKIVHRLQEVGARVTERLKELNVETLVATEDTVKSLKDLRAELNKELDNFEEQRKFVKSGVLNPYNEFEAVYKAEISEKYKAAVDTLKTKIEVVENKVKAEKRDRIKVFHEELCAAEGIDFIPFEKLNLDINLSTSEKKYRDQVAETITRVQDDLNLIRTEDHQAEILTEYKKSLNAAQAITTVRTRKEAERAEADRIRMIEVQRRQRVVQDMGMLYDSMTNAYVYNDEVFLGTTFLSQATKDEFNMALIDAQEKITADKAANPQQGEMAFGAPTPAAPVAAPAVAVAPKKTEGLVKAQFEVTGTMPQLRALGQYMKDNNITYKNI